MTTLTNLHAAARQAGLAVTWQDANGKSHKTDPDVLQALLNTIEIHEGNTSSRPSPLIIAQVGEAVALPFQNSNPASYVLQKEDGSKQEGKLKHDKAGLLLSPICNTPGYHILEYGHHTIKLAVAPTHCEDLKARTANQKAWGTSVQIPALRQKDDGGFGHLGSVADLALSIGNVGADALMISPIHALSPLHPEQCSPYSPSSRRYFNPLLANLEVCFSRQLIHSVYRQHSDWAVTFERMQKEKLIDWEKAGVLKLKLMRALYDKHIACSLPPEFVEFIAAGGDALRNHAIFEALQAHQLLRGPRGDNWRSWGPPYKKPSTPEVQHFAKAHQKEVYYWLFLQWITAKSLKEAASATKTSGMSIGLISDIAVGLSPSGAECWANQDSFLIGASIGAPPDLLAPQGQNWGLTTFSPRALKRTGYDAFIAMLRSGFQAGGGIRFDHVMGLERIWIVPDGGNSSDGTYLSMPQKDLKNLLALESFRAKGVVIGEDLGTVPKGFRSRMAERRIWGMNVMWFEKKDKEQFLSPIKWSDNGIAMTSTHDLPTVAGWWMGADLPNDTTCREKRHSDRAALWAMFQSTSDNIISEMPPITSDGAQTVVDAAIKSVGQASGPLALLPMEDLLGVEDQPNVPGNQTSHPNWRDRYPVQVDQIIQYKNVSNRIETLKIARGKK